MIWNWLKAALVPLLQIFLCFAAHAESGDTLPVTIVPDRVNLEEDARAVFSANGSELVMFDRRGVYLWDTASRRLVRSILYPAFARAAVFTPDRKQIISAHKDGSIRTWDVASGTQVALLQKGVDHGDVDEPSALAPSPDGRLLVSGTSGGKLVVWDLKKREKKLSFDFASRPEEAGMHIIALRLAPDLKSVTAVTWSTVKRFDLATGRELTAYRLPNEKDKQQYEFSEDSLVSGDGLIARNSPDGCGIPELDYLSLKEPDKLIPIDKPADCRRPDDAPYSLGEVALFVDPAKSAVLIARGDDAVLKEWDLKTHSISRTIQWSNGQKPELIGASEDFSKIVSNADDRISIRALDDGKSLGDFGTSSYMTDTVLAEDGRSILLSQQIMAREHPQQRLWWWEVGSAEPAKTVLVGADSDTTIRDFSPQAKLASATTKDGFVLYSLETGAEVHRFTIKQIKTPYGFRLSLDGKLGIVIGDGPDPDDTTVGFLVDPADGSIKLQFEDRTTADSIAHVTDGAFSPDGRQFAVGYFDNTAELWDIKSLKRVKRFPPLKGDDADRVWSLRFTPDTKKMISGSRDSGAFLWNLETTRAPRLFSYDDMSAMHPYLAGVALSHDGSTVVAGSSQHAISSGDTGRQRNIDLWNAANGKSRGHWIAHDYGVTVVTFSPDDRWIISASRDGTIKYWKAETHKCVATIVVSNDGHWFVLSDSGFFSGDPGDGNLLSVSRGASVRPWQDFREKLDKPDLIAALLKGDPEHRYAKAARELDLGKVWEGAGH